MGRPLLCSEFPHSKQYLCICMKAWSCTYRSTCLYRRVLFPTVHFSSVPVCLHLHLSVSILFQYFVSTYNSLLNQLFIEVHVDINYIE